MGREIVRRSHHLAIPHICPVLIGDNHVSAFSGLGLTLSRPKTIDDVSSQEHTVAVLQKALASTNVSAPLYPTSRPRLALTAAAAHALLRSTWNGED